MRKHKDAEIEELKKENEKYKLQITQLEEKVKADNGSLVRNEEFKRLSEKNQELTIQN